MENRKVMSKKNRKRHFIENLVATPTRLSIHVTPGKIIIDEETRKDIIAINKKLKLLEKIRQIKAKRK